MKNTKFYVTYMWKPTDETIDIDYCFMNGDTDNMEETLHNWYKELGDKTSHEPEACLTIINWKVL